ncbi:co-chaperone GroES [bacterium (Candidatus Gribaldobacteria) CG23_combo_of_CG06-09_8_20_14_all_37_87_8]|uniref:Co-chaperonin GroES n=2 Tax=Candidatus Gribaldobacteria TaxID=2798536 RepID=A0A2G9ZEB9_9BACT|nr:MAG: co-chaperone GroES [Parcubacteria group bacterium CG1_02_37_13]PIP31516.1 MAG: co-chaperone GroES [bacterium (Candidatus Gribaldobacteria) CG23_combo_of_CG06-09_8_20_14_all_37_87_8]PIR90644.1 MAG: co-chaperone GroES [bacterium (Candidatus Gribaldobacteria) CG10_big_fil_rev_8_21_14_0_10_37_21]
MNIKPLSEYVVLEPMAEEEKTKSGIFLPHTAQKDEPEQGKVVAVGAGKTMSNGQKKEVEVKVGDLVLFNKYGPNKVKIEGKEYLIAKQDDILAILS